MAQQIQLRRDTAANWTSTDPTLAQAEIGFETDTGNLKIGDGSTAWSSLAYGLGTLSWGQLIGTLSDQADLQTALDAKADLAGDTFTGDIELTGTTRSIEFTDTGSVVRGVLTSTQDAALEDNLTSLAANDTGASNQATVSVAGSSYSYGVSFAVRNTGDTAYLLHLYNRDGTVDSEFHTWNLGLDQYDLSYISTSDASDNVRNRIFMLSPDGLETSQLGFLTYDTSGTPMGGFGIYGSAQTYGFDLFVRNTGDTANLGMSWNRDGTIDASDFDSLELSTGNVLTEADEHITQQADDSLGTGTHTFDYSAGRHQQLTVTGDITIAFSNFPSGKTGLFMFDLVNAGAHTITWPTHQTEASVNLSTDLTSSGTDHLIARSDKDGDLTIYIVGTDVS